MNVSEILDRCTSHGWLTLNEAELMIRYAEMTEGLIVEVGSYQGRSSRLLAELGRPLLCIDPWDDHFHSDLKGQEIYEKWVTNLQGFENVVSVRSRIEEWSPIPAGFVYLDGDHTYEGTRVQVQKALECRPRCITVHDYMEDGGGAKVAQACNELLGTPNERSGRMAAWRIS